MSTQNIYFYSPSNFAYAGAGIKNTGDSLPPNSTLVAPGAPAAQTAQVWGGASWSSVADFRNYPIFLKETGAFSGRQENLGPVNAAYTIIVPPDFPVNPTTNYTWSVESSLWVIDNNKVQNGLASIARLKRNNLLIATDWVEGMGIPITNAALKLFAEYRQYLRDVPAQMTFPGTIDWPVVPAYQKDVTIDTAANKCAAIQAGYGIATS